jgi:hypothetical protein
MALPNPDIVSAPLPDYDVKSQQSWLLIAANAADVADHPKNPLAIVRHIRLLRDEQNPEAVDSELISRNALADRSS